VPQGAGAARSGAGVAHASSSTAAMARWWAAGGHPDAVGAPTYQPYLNLSLAESSVTLDLAGSYADVIPPQLCHNPRHFRICLRTLFTHPSSPFRVLMGNLICLLLTPQVWPCSILGARPLIRHRQFQISLSPILCHWTHLSHPNSPYTKLTGVLLCLLLTSHLTNHPCWLPSVQGWIFAPHSVATIPGPGAPAAELSSPTPATPAHPGWWTPSVSCHHPSGQGWRLTPSALPPPSAPPLPQAHLNPPQDSLHPPRRPLYIPDDEPSPSPADIPGLAWPISEGKAPFPSPVDTPEASRPNVALVETKDGELPPPDTCRALPGGPHRWSCRGGGRPLVA